MPPAPEIVHHRYGKTRVRMMKVVRGRERHDVKDIDVSISLTGDFGESFTSDDNRRVLPTDTMKNTVYALGRDHPLESIESFALHLADHFVTTVPQVGSATVAVAASAWDRVVTDGAAHPHAFLQGGHGRETCSVTVADGQRRAEAGIRDLVIMKTTASGFSGFARDRFTTLRETDDRVMRTSVTATWSYLHPDADFNGCRRTITEALVSAFADHYSPSVQFTLHGMGRRALEKCPEISRITLALPNLHCLLVDLSPFELTNDNEIFLPVEEPHGLIEATLERQQT